MWYLDGLKSRALENSEDWICSGPDGVLTYRMLGRICRQLTPMIHAAASETGIVIVKCDKTIYAPAAFFCINLLGMAYVPVAADIPEDRLKSIMSAVSAKQVLDLSDTTKLVEELDGAGPATDADFDAFIGWIEEMADQPRHDLMYMLFTSGSTGVPKGVMIAEENVSCFVERSVIAFDLRRSDVFLNQVPFTFDLSVLDVYAAFHQGTKFVMVPKDRGADTEYLIDLMAENEITTIYTTPSFFNLLRLARNFSAEKLPTLRTFLFCGEVLPRRLAGVYRKLFQKARVFNLYGPTETNVVTYVELDDEVMDGDGPLPIGLPYHDTTLHLLDEQLNPVEEGEQGELCFEGPSIARGYLNLEAKTNEVFVDLQDGRECRIYRTGDLGFEKDGQIWLVGRKDNQIKLNGFRIELGEIETHVEDIAGVEAAAVVAVRNKRGECTGILAAVQTNVDLTSEIINQALRKSIPDYMLPTAYRIQDRFELTPHGKIDRSKLLAG